MALRYRLADGNPVSSVRCRPWKPPPRKHTGRLDAVHASSSRLLRRPHPFNANKARTKLHLPISPNLPPRPRADQIESNRIAGGTAAPARARSDLPAMASLTLPPALPNPRQDAIDLHKAFKGFGCDSTTVINILTHRDSVQRGLIQQEYRAMYHEELFHRISSELSGNHKKAMSLWILDPAGRDATVLREALSGDTVDLRAATEVICSRTPSQLQIMKQTYYARFGTYLEHDIGHHTSGDHQKILLAYVGIPRYEGPEVDPTIVTHDAKDLYKAGEKRLGTDEKTFIRVFTERSWAHLASVSSAYHHMYDRKLEKVVKSETSGNFEFALLTILRCAENPAKYFAKLLRKAMKGLGTDDKTLIRVVVTRTEIDMQYIKAEYFKKYKKPLAEAINSETSGNYRTFLLSLVGHGH